MVSLAVMVACGGEKSRYDATGTFEATEVIVSAEGNGRLIMLNVTEGEVLQAGNVIGRVDTVPLYLQKRQSEATLKAVASRYADVSTEVAALRQQIATATTERQRFENLVKAGAAHQKQVDDIAAQIAVAERQLEARMTTLGNMNRGVREEGAALEAQIARLDDQLLKCRIASPITGTVLAKYAEPGEVTSVGKPLFKVADMERMFLRGYVTSDQLSRVKRGDEVTVYIDFDKDDRREYNGRITWISDRAEFTPKNIQTRDERANQVYAVKIAVNNDGWLRIGMYGEVKFKP